LDSLVDECEVCHISCLNRIEVQFKVTDKVTGSVALIKVKVSRTVQDRDMITTDPRIGSRVL